MGKTQTNAKVKQAPVEAVQEVKEPTTKPSKSVKKGPAATSPKPSKTKSVPVSVPAPPASAASTAPVPPVKANAAPPAELKPAKKATPSKSPKAASSAPAKTGVKLRKTALSVKAADAVPAPVITNDDIALRAYYIGEKRQTLGLPGDSTQDWVEAERQLVAESKLKKRS